MQRLKHTYNSACANPQLFVSSCCLLSCTVGLFMVSSCFDEWPFGRPHAPFASLHLTTFPPFYIQRYLTQSLISGMLLWKPRLAGVWSRDVGSQCWRSMPLTHKDLPLFLLFSSPSQHLMQRQVHNTSQTENTVEPTLWSDLLYPHRTNRLCGLPSLHGFLRNG